MSTASVLPALRAATVEDLARAGLDRDRVAASAVRLIDFGLFGVGDEICRAGPSSRRTTLEKRQVTVTRDGMMFDYAAKEGKRRAVTVTDEVVLPTVRALAHNDNGLDTLFSYQHHDALARPAFARREQLHRRPGRRPLHG